MADQKHSMWRRVVSCALTNSVDRKTGMLLPGAEKPLEESAVRYITRREGLSEDDARRLYAQCRTAAAGKKRADGATPLWVPLLMITGVLAGIINGINFIATGFNPFFLLFLLLGVSIYRTGAKTLKAAAPERKAAVIWQESLHGSLNSSMDDALLRMEAVFTDASVQKK